MNDFSVLDEMSHSVVDMQYTKAYLRHLIIAGELLGAQIATLHNLGFYLWLVRESFNQIEKGAFTTWKAHMVKSLSTRL